MSDSSVKIEDKNELGGFVNEKVIETDATLLERVELACRELRLDLSVEEINFVIHKLDSRNWQEAKELLVDAVDYHDGDINLDYDYYLQLKSLSEGAESYSDLTEEEYHFAVKFQSVIVCDWSPYAEVRAVTSMVDNPEEPAETIRMYIVGVIFANVGAIVATFFGNRYPSITLSFLALQLIIYPFGRFLELVLPDWGFHWGGKRHSLNPGPWSFKEQMLSTLMMSACDGPPFSFNYITVQRSDYFFNEKWAGSWGYMILLSLTSAFTGYGIAGLLRGLLVYPVRCVWYGVLPILSMNRSLTKKETKENVHGWTINRFPFLLLFTLISFCWYWFPEFVFTALSYFSWITWIAPNNVKLAAVTGVFTGMGVNPISTFDWSVFGGAGMVSPWYTTLVQYTGQWLGGFVIMGIYFSKSYFTQYLPINAPGVYDNTGLPYDVTRIITEDGKFNQTGYENYSPAFLTAGSLIVYGTNFAVFPASIVYAILYYRQSVWTSIKAMQYTFRQTSDETQKMYKNPFMNNVHNPQVPGWWFAIVLLLSLVLFIVMVEVYKETETPVWSVFFAIAMNLVFIVPLGLLYATTNNYVQIGLFIQVLIGYLIPHNANAMMITQCIANNFWQQAQFYVANQKLTHYARIPSRALFRVQYLGTFVTIFTTLSVLNWEFTGIRGYCDPQQPQKFTCAANRSNFASFVLWGTLGPRLYLNGIYKVLKYSFLIGVFIPIPFYFLEKWKPSVFRRWNALLLISGAMCWAPLNLYYTTTNLYVALIFNYYIRKYYLAWWRKYSYILFAAMSTGVAWAAIIVFFATSYNRIATINWWGNNVYMGGPNGTGADWNGIPLVPVPDKGYFGPDPVDYPPV